MGCAKARGAMSAAAHPTTKLIHHIENARGVRIGQYLP